MVAGGLASLMLAAPAAAAPELFVRTQKWDTHEETGAWIPLASAPALNYLGGYEIGYKLEAGGFQTAALTIAGVPDGSPTQPSNASPYCVGRNGTTGDIVAAGPELQFEGNGTYTVTVSVKLGGASDCLTTGASTTASFAVDVHVAPSLAGAPLVFRAVPLAGNPFVGVQAPAPPGGSPDVRCALNATVQPDGSLTGSALAPGGDFAHPSVIERAFPRPGAWMCVARGVAEGQDENRDTVLFGTPWSAPLTLEVRSDFRRRTGALARPRSKRPRFRFAAEFPEAANGGRATVALFRVTGCRGHDLRLRKVGTYRGSFGPKRVRIAMRRPRVAGFYVGRFSFSGTHFLRRSVDPRPMLLRAQRDRVEFVSSSGFPGC